MSIAPFISRYWPFANGSGRILDKFAGRIDLGTGEREARTTDNFSINVLADDLIGRHILLSGRFDRSVVQALLDQARPGDVLVDIGANIGYVTGCFLSTVADSRAVCVEPQPGIYELLEKNVRQFGGRATTKQIALSDADGVLRFHIDRANRGASRVAPDGEIAIDAIDAAKFFSTLSRVDLIKIDVEGHEAPIFRAIEGELGRLKPRAILFEDQGTGASPVAEIGAILRRCGYRIYGIEKRLLRTRLSEVKSAADCEPNDYLAIRE